MPWVLLYDWNMECYYFVFGVHGACTHHQPRIQTLQCEAMLRRAYEVSQGTPFILAGDFNFVPGSDLHRFVTTGVCTATIAPCTGFSSAYRVFDPLAKHRNLVSNRTPEFAGKIDYVFTSFDYLWELESFHLDSPEGPLPDAEHGSDHVALSCKLVLKLEHQEEPKK
jgi:endonuclease/exonuclease/phosphatase family metal-dependent hydrolase